MSYGALSSEIYGTSYMDASHIFEKAVNGEEKYKDRIFKIQNFIETQSTLLIKL